MARRSSSRISAAVVTRTTHFPFVQRPWSDACCPLTGEMSRINAVLVVLTFERLYLEFGWNHCGSADGLFDHVGNVFGRDLNGVGIASLHHDTR
jgi:hypothetical protein